LLIWLGVHLVTLVNFSNILRTLYSWVVAYLSRDQNLRMIFRPETIPADVPLPVNISLKQTGISKLPGDGIPEVIPVSNLPGDKPA